MWWLNWQILIRQYLSSHPQLSTNIETAMLSSIHEQMKIQVHISLVGQSTKWPPHLNLKLRHERSATAISVGYWYSRMYQRPINWKISKDQNTYLFIACILWKYTCDFYELKGFQRLNFSTSVVGTLLSSKVLWYFETSLGKVTYGELTFLMFKFALESATGQAMPS